MTSISRLHHFRQGAQLISLIPTRRFQSPRCLKPSVRSVPRIEHLATPIAKPMKRHRTLRNRVILRIRPRWRLIIRTFRHRLDPVMYPGSRWCIANGRYLLGDVEQDTESDMRKSGKKRRRDFQRPELKITDVSLHSHRNRKEMTTRLSMTTCYLDMIGKHLTCLYNKMPNQ